jgi:hypothetical protein
MVKWIFIHIIIQNISVYLGRFQENIFCNLGNKFHGFQEEGRENLKTSLNLLKPSGNFTYHQV